MIGPKTGEAYSNVFAKFVEKGQEIQPIAEIIKNLFVLIPRQRQSVKSESYSGHV